MKGTNLQDSLSTQRPLIYVAVAIACAPMFIATGHDVFGALALLGLLDLRNARLSSSSKKGLLVFCSSLLLFAILLRTSWGSGSDKTLFAAVAGAIFALVVVNVVFVACRSSVEK